jgi:type II secretion system protein C
MILLSKYIYWVLLALLPIVGTSAPTVLHSKDVGVVILGYIVGSKRAPGNVALIKSTSSGKVAAVKPGYKVLGKYLVTAVNEKFITMRKGTKDFILYAKKYAPKAPKTPTPRRSVPKWNSGYLAGLDEYNEPGFSRKGNDTQITAAYRDKLLKSEMAKILMQATAQPVTGREGLAGWRLSQIDKGSIFDKAGVRNGDIIQSINGKKLKHAGQAVRLLQSMRSQKDFEISVVRGGKPTSLKLGVQ